MSRPNLIVASYRSPVDYSNDVSQSSLGGLTQALIGCMKPNDYWVAVSQGENDPNLVDDDGVIVTTGEGFEFKQLKIFLNPETNQRYYGITANAHIWPLFHLNQGTHYNRSTTFPRPRFDGNAFFSYAVVNEIFAKAIYELAGGNTTDTTIWLQDYHLLLTPAKLKERNPALTVSQFIHIPMFNPAVTKPYFNFNGESEEATKLLIAGMLDNDLLGFHIHEYVDNFGQTVRQFFPTAKVSETEKGLLITHNDKHCYVEAFPIGVDVDGISTLVKDGAAPNPIITTEGKTLEEFIKEDKNEGRKIIAGVERCDYTKGLVERFAILEQLLKQGLSMHYVGAIAPPREGIEEYQHLFSEVQETHQKFNQRWQQKLGYEPATIIYGGLQPPYGLLSQADCILLPLIEDGMNIVFHETVLSQQYREHRERGIIAIGNAGIEKHAASFGNQHGLVRIDPFNPENAAGNIIRALQAPYHISDALIRFIRNQDVKVWRDTFLQRLSEIKAEKKKS